MICHSKMKTPIVYYGGKVSLLNHILPMIPFHTVYTETFFGGGSVFFAKKAVINETINDRLDYVINFYLVLKNDFHSLKKLIDVSLVSRTIHRQALSILREQNTDSVLRAWAFWYCCHFSFFNKIGGHLKYSNSKESIPQGLTNKKKEFTELLVSRIENATIENKDAIHVLKKRNVKDAFHYLDPPYVGTYLGNYNGYTENHFIDLLDFLPSIKGRFLLSYILNPILEEYLKLYDWQIKKVEKIVKGAICRIEVLVWNYQLPGVQSQLNF